MIPIRREYTGNEEITKFLMNTPNRITAEQEKTEQEKKKQPKKPMR